MFNPTVIRIAKVGKYTALVVNNSVTDDTYFQIYESRGDVGTFLAYAMPWTLEQDACLEFQEWVETGHVAHNNRRIAG